MELANRPGCYVWNPSLTGPAPGATVTWSGQCSGGLAQGTGLLTWVWDGNEQVDAGWLQDGEQTGHWVLRRANGAVGEGPYVAGEQTGHWVLRFANGAVEEGPYVDGERHGDWLLRTEGGGASVHRYVNGERVDR